MVEVGKARPLVRLIPLTAALVLVGLAYNFGIYHGLNDAQSMDNAQLARQISRGQGFTTEFVRPHAVAQLHDFSIAQNLQTGRSPDLFPPDRFPPGAPRVLPDTYNAPGYPYLLAAWFRIVHPEFAQPSSAIISAHAYSGDRWIPPLNLIFMLLTALMVFVLGHRLFDERTAWMSSVAFLATDLVWQFSMTALSTMFLTFLVTGMLMCVLEIFCVGELCFEHEERSFVPAWLWSLGAGVLLAAACLTRLHLVILVVPLFFALLVMPRASIGLPLLIALVVAAGVGPWLLHMMNICGNPLGSNAPLLYFGQGDYKGNQIYCATSIPSYEALLRNAVRKEYAGFRWHFENVWSLLGACPLILFFGASLLHQFKRRRTQLFHWLLVGCAVVIVVANSLAVTDPASLGPWNTLFVLFPCMIVVGSAFFFIMLDRMSIQIGLLNNIIVGGVLLLNVIPLLLSLTNGNGLLYNFPPYAPFIIKALSEYSDPDEWVTTDMPWATAWYGDRASLWLPDSITDFQNFHDNVCPTGILILTPVTTSMPVETFTSGEYKDWFSFVMNLQTPPTFPLSVHTATAGSSYSVWSDRPRWQGK
jgi:4-amino-4-deoxy-L-arabinose transferase-like glycosyltransferase